VDGVSAVQRRVLPLAELRVEFTLSRAELQAGDRGADDVDLAPLDQAVHTLASAENRAVFHGWGGAVTGIAETSPSRPLDEALAGSVAGAVESLLEQGVGGPYGLALGPGLYRTVTGSVERGGYPLYDHVRAILGGPIIWSPGVSGAVVLSTRGGDFIFESGQDISIGYLDHDAESVRLYLEESFSFHVATPEAAVVLSVS
jgi:uncharacterized linocin/CFP29 family protein